MTPCLFILIPLALLAAASPAFAAAPATTAPATLPALADITVERARLRRHYFLFVPAHLDASKPAPLVLMLHGAGGTAAGAATNYGWCELAEKENFIAAFPEATRFNLTRPANFYVNPPIWNDGSQRGFAGRNKIDDVGYLRDVIDDVSRRRSVDPSRVYCAGFSNGASMTFRAGVELSDKLAAIAPVSGHFWMNDPRPARQLPLLFLCGDSDPLNPVEGGIVAGPWGNSERKPPLQKSIDAWIKLLAVDATAHTIRDDDAVHAVRYGEESADRQALVYMIHKQGHEWPGHGRVLPRALTGETSDAIDATKVIWEFFKSHTKRD